MAAEPTAEPIGKGAVDFKVAVDVFVVGAEVFLQPVATEASAKNKKM